MLVGTVLASTTPVEQWRQGVTTSTSAIERQTSLADIASMTRPEQGEDNATDVPPRTTEFNGSLLLPKGRSSIQDVNTSELREPTTTVNTDKTDNETKSICLTLNSNESRIGNYSERNCDGNDEDIIHIQSFTSYLAYVVGVGINRYVLPMLVIVGACGNFISMLVMFQRQNRHTSFSIYLGNLAISDNCVLFGVGYYWVASELLGRMFYDIECKILIWMLDTFQQNGVLLILSVTLDRLVAVRFPFNAAAWCRAKRAKIVSACVFVVVAVYSLPHLLFNYADEQLVCMLCSFDNILCVIHLWVTAFIAFAIPFVLLLSMNVVIIRTVRNSMKYQSKYRVESCGDTTTTDQSEDIDTSGQSVQSVASVSQSERGEARSQNQQLSSKDRNLIVMLLLVSFMFLILNAPRFMRIIIFATVKFEPTPERIALNTLAWHITNKLYFSNNACNFFLYCVSGSKFRRDFKALFRENVCRCCFKKTTE